MNPIRISVALLALSVFLLTGAAFGTHTAPDAQAPHADATATPLFDEEPNFPIVGIIFPGGIPFKIERLVGPGPPWPVEVTFPFGQWKGEMSCDPDGDGYIITFNALSAGPLAEEAPASAAPLQVTMSLASDGSLVVTPGNFKGMWAASN